MDETLLKDELGTHGFRINTVALMHEIVDCAIPDTGGILKIPINILMRYLDSIATRASQLNDPILNKLMCDMALYEVSDPYSKEFDQKVVDEVDKKAAEYKAKCQN